MTNKTMLACQVCGEPFYGSRDFHYCPACARGKKLDTVIRIRSCQDCGIEFYGGQSVAWTVHIRHSRQQTGSTKRLARSGHWGALTDASFAARSM